MVQNIQHMRCFLLISVFTGWSLLHRPQNEGLINNRVNIWILNLWDLKQNSGFAPE